VSIENYIFNHTNPRTGNSPEVDFVIEAGNRCIAVEVKAGARWEKADLAGLKAFVASTHRSNFYQRMTDLGMTHRKVTSIELLAGIACGGLWVWGKERAMEAMLL
jgi:hypothetical protein